MEVPADQTVLGDEDKNIFLNSRGFKPVVCWTVYSPGGNINQNMTPANF